MVKKIIGAIAVALIICAMPFLLLPDDVPADDSFVQKSCTITKTINSDSIPFDISIIGYEESVEFTYNIILNIIGNQKDSSLDSKSCLVIFVDGYVDYDNIKQTISNAVTKGDKVSFAFTDVDWNLISYPNSHPDNPDVFGLYVGEQKTSSFSRIGFEKQDEIRDLLSWASSPTASPIGTFRDTPAPI